MPLVFSSQPLRPDTRERAWRALVDQQFGGLRVMEAAPDLHASLAVSGLGPDGRVVRLEGSPQRVRRDAKRDATGETWNLLVQEHGRCRVRHRGEAFVLDAGSFTAIDGREGFELELEQPFGQWLVQLPRGRVLARLPHLTRGGLGASSTTPGDHYLHRLIVETAHAAETVTGPAQAALVDVLCAALPLSELLRESAPSSASFTRACLVLERFAYDPSFGPDPLAAKLRASRRHVEQVFAAEGTTIARELWRIRLQRCARELTSPENRHRTLLDIATANGFSSASHFTRAFRERFGVSPSAYRQAQRAG